MDSGNDEYSESMNGNRKHQFFLIVLYSAFFGGWSSRALGRSHGFNV